MDEIIRMNNFGAWMIDRGLYKDAISVLGRALSEVQQRLHQHEMKKKQSNNGSSSSSSSDSNKFQEHVADEEVEKTDEEEEDQMSDDEEDISEDFSATESSMDLDDDEEEDVEEDDDDDEDEQDMETGTIHNRNTANPSTTTPFNTYPPNPSQSSSSSPTSEVAGGNGKNNDDEEEECFVYCKPVHITEDSDYYFNGHHGGEKEVEDTASLGVILVFNMALSNHLWAMMTKKSTMTPRDRRRQKQQQKQQQKQHWTSRNDDNDDDDNDYHQRQLVAALKLYQLCYSMQRHGNRVLGVTHALSLLNNSGHIHKTLGRDKDAQNCFQYLLSSLMCIVDAGEQNLVDEIDGFFSNAMFRPLCTATTTSSSSSRSTSRNGVAAAA